MDYLRLSYPHAFQGSNAAPTHHSDAAAPLQCLHSLGALVKRQMSAGKSFLLEVLHADSSPGLLDQIRRSLGIDAGLCVHAIRGPGVELRGDDGRVLRRHLTWLSNLRLDPADMTRLGMPRQFLTGSAFFCGLPSIWGLRSPSFVIIFSGFPCVAHMGAWTLLTLRN